MTNELEVVEGMQFDRGFMSPYFITDAEKQRVVLENAYVLSTTRRSRIFAICCRCSRSLAGEPPTAAVAEDVTGDALATLVVNSLRGILKACAVKAPGFGDRRKALLEDIAILTGGRSSWRKRATSSKRSHRRARASAPDRNRQGRHNADRERGEADNIKGRIAQIRKAIDETTSDYDRKQLEERAARLAGGVA